MKIDRIEVHKSDDDALEVTMRGDPAKIVEVLVSGLPREALVQINDALIAEMAKRNGPA